MSLNSKSFKQRLNDVESFIIKRDDAIAFLDEISNTDIIQAHQKINMYDAVSRKELAFLVGLLLRKKSFDNYLNPLGNKYSEDIEKIRHLLRELHLEIFRGKGISKLDQKVDYFSEETLVETTFYEESGYYNDQPLLFSQYLYEHDEEWIFKNKGFKLDSLISFYYSTCEVLANKRINYINNKEHYGINDIFFTIKEVQKASSESLNDEHQLDAMTIKRIINSFSCRPGSQFSSFKRPGDENILTYYPIIEIKKGVYWLPLPDMLAHAIYLSPLHWMREDEAYKNVVDKHIGVALEEICGGLLEKTFDDVYDAVEIYKGKNRLTDIDSLAIHDNTAIVVQAKNKRMMPTTFSGDIKSLKTDFEIVAQQAYNQGEKSCLALKDLSKYKFRQNGQELKIPKITQVYILCVSSGVYYAGATQVNEYLKQKYPETNLPVLLSVFDLDLLTRYLTNPNEFIYYLKLRVTQYKKIASNNEVAPLSSYLFSDFMHDTESDRVLLMDDLITPLDSDYYKNQLFNRPNGKGSFSVRFNDAPHFVSLLESVYKSKNTGKEKVLELLFSLPIEAIRQLEDKMKTHSLSILSKENCGFTGVFDTFGISYYNGIYININELLNRMFTNADLYKKNAWIGVLYKDKTYDFLYIER